MRFLRRLLLVLIGLPILIVTVVLAVANRQPVPIILDPFNPAEPVLSFTAPLYLVVLVAVLLGALIGGVSTWFGQGRHRREKWHARMEVARLDREAERLRREAASREASEPVSSSRAVALRKVA